MSKNDGYTAALLEDIDSKFDRVIEAVGTLGEEIKRKADAEALEVIHADIKVIKAAITDTNTEVQSQGRRITALES